MADHNGVALSELITGQEAKLLTSWLRIQINGGSLRSGQIKEDQRTVATVPARVCAGDEIRQP
jgi:hypothetical protein